MGSSLRTSLIRPTDMAALGRIIEIMVIIKKDIIICMVSWINAIISPTCMVPVLILSAPTHTIRIATKFIISIRAGIIKVITRPTNRLFLVRAVLTLSNRSFSWFSLLKALITGRPQRISLITRLTLSTSFCISLNFGSATTISIITRESTAPTPTPKVQVMVVLVFNILIIPPSANMGE